MEGMTRSTFATHARTGPTASRWKSWIRSDDGGGRDYVLTPRGRGLFPIFAFLLS